MGAINSIGLDGRHFERIVTGLQGPRGIAVFEEFVYWTDIIQHAVYKVRVREKLKTS